MLTTRRADGSPITIPVWFDWDGATLSMFCGAASAKVGRIDRDPRITVLVANEVDEPENWVVFEGEATVGDGGFEVAEELAGRYWDLTDASRANTLEEWRSAASAFARIDLTPTRILGYGGE